MEKDSIPAHLIGLILILLITRNITSAATIITVPGTQPTIQAGINSAAPGDMVLVSSGTYLENIDFLGKAITVKSASGPAVTVIDGGKKRAVVTFQSGEGRNSTLSGFTIQNGVQPVGGFGGAGVVINASSPTVTKNIITQNFFCEGGGGIGVTLGSPLIQSNTIASNSQLLDCSGGEGGGGMLLSGGQPQVISNKILDNSWGGIVVAGGTPVIENNTITGSTGFGLSTFNDASPVVVQNIIYGNHGTNGGGVSLSASAASKGSAIIVNNTIVDNDATKGSELFVTGFDSGMLIFNNLFINNSGLNAVYCDTTYSSTPPVFQFNDAFSAGGTSVGGSCATDFAGFGINGNISYNPFFQNATNHNYHLTTNSRVLIDAGLNYAPALPSKDFGGAARFIDGNSDGLAVVDMGAYEFVPLVTVSPSTLSFGTQAIGSNTTLNVILTNNWSSTLSVSVTTDSSEYHAAALCTNPIPIHTTCTIAVTFVPDSVGTQPANLVVTDNYGASPQHVSLVGAGK